YERDSVTCVGFDDRLLSGRAMCGRIVRTTTEFAAADSLGGASYCIAVASGGAFIACSVHARQSVADAIDYRGDDGAGDPRGGGASQGSLDTAWQPRHQRCRGSGGDVDLRVFHHEYGGTADAVV